MQVTLRERKEVREERTRGEGMMRLFEEVERVEQLLGISHGEIAIGKNPSDNLER